MKKIGIILYIIFCTSIVHAKLPPTSTELYSFKAKGCQSVDLKNWTHPTRKVLIDNNIKIEKVQLCNNNKYPIFIGESKFDLSTHPNRHIARHFFHSLLKANANWNYAFVDTNSQAIIYVAKYAENDIVFSYENY